MIRQAEAQDVEAIHQICLLTAADGKDGTQHYHFPQLLYAIYVDPYLKHDPTCCFVAEDESGVCGYTLAALNAGETLAWAVKETLPQLRRDFPLADPSGRRTVFDQVLVEILHHPFELPGFAVAYPSELHIDLHPRAQGRGLGRQLITRVCARLEALASPGVFLGVSWQNENARAFYRHLGFSQLAAIPEETEFFGKKLAEGTSGH